MQRGRRRKRHMPFEPFMRATGPSGKIPSSAYSHFKWQVTMDRPVNVLMGLPGLQLSLAELSALGVKRVSVGSALCRAALGAFLRATGEMKEHGTFAFAKEAVSYRDIDALFKT